MSVIEEVITLVNALLNGGALILLGKTIRELRRLVRLAQKVDELAASRD